MSFTTVGQRGMSIETIGSVNSLPAGVHVGEYLLQGVVGEGGFGIVYRAHDRSLDRVVAIKEYMPSTLVTRGASNKVHVRAQQKGAFDAGLRSFINEARLLAKFSHPALVHVYRFFEANDTAYMVMRHYEGQTLGAVLKGKSIPMSERWLSGMLSPLLDVLEMLHAADCYHRDISPDNVLLDVSGMPVLLDFGAARRVIGDMTQALTMVLKPGFAPIEQYVDDGGMPQGAWTDVYQLGAMLYLAITGRPPATAVARMIQDSVGLLSATDHPGYSQKFLQGVHQALAVKPQDRPQSIAELKALLGIVTFTVSSTSAWSILGVEAPPPDPSNNPAHNPVVAQAAQASLPQSFGIDRKDVHGNFPVTGALNKDASAANSAQGVAVLNAKSTPWRRLKVWLTLGFLIAAITLVVASVRTHTSERRALEDADNVHWAVASSAGTRESLQGYLQAYPQGINAKQAQASLDALAPAREHSPSMSHQPALPTDIDATNSTPPALPLPAAQSATKTASGVSPDTGNSTQPRGEVVAGTVGNPDKVDMAQRSLSSDGKPEVAVKKGVVTIKVMPWGNVRINRALMGTTPPLTKLDLPEGSYQIEISNPAAATKTFAVQVKSGEPVMVEHKFE